MPLSTPGRKNRRVKGLLLGLVAFGLLSVAAAYAGSDAYVLEPAPQSIEVTPQRVGDSGTYRIRILQDDQGSTSVVQDNQSVSFERLPDERAYDAGGQPRTVDAIRLRLLTDRVNGRNESESLILRRGVEDGRLVSATEYWDLHRTLRPSTATDLVQRTFLDDYHETWFWPQAPTCGKLMQGWHEQCRGDLPGLAICGLRLPTGRWELTQPVALFPDCRLSGERDAAQSFSAIGVDTTLVPGAVVFSSDDGPNRTYAWIRDGAAFPSRVVEELGDGRFFELLLADERRGEGPPDLDAPSPGAPLPSLDWGPRQRWGPDEEGVPHPFPLSEVVTLPGDADDPNRTRLVRFMEEHPDAYVAFGESWGEQWEENGGRSWHWAVGLSDGVDWIDFFVTKMVGPPERIGPVFVPTAPGEETTYWYGDSCYFCTPRRVPRPADAPATLPTVKSILERGLPVLGPQPEDRYGTAYSFLIECEDETCRSTDLRLSAGYIDGHQVGNRRNLAYDDRTGKGVPNPLFQWWNYHNFTYVYMEENGLLMNGFDRQQAVHVRSELAQSPPETPPRAAKAIQGRPETVAQDWVVPSVASVVGAGLVATLIGLVYWAWPALKQSMWAPFYTRLALPAALAQPARANIYAAIQANPGIHFQALVRRVGGGSGAVLHHVRTLRHFGLIRQVQGPGYTCYVPSDWGHASILPAFPVLKAEGARRMLQTILAEPGLSNAELARRTGLSTPSVSHHVRRLVEAKLVTVEASRRPAPIRATASAATALAAAGESVAPSAGLVGG